MGFLVRLSLALLAALAIGVGSALWMLAGVPESSFAANGAWRIAPVPAHGFYRRAAAAQQALLAPEARDALTLTATTDETGAPLSAACSYRIEGARQPAQGVGVAAYGPDGHLLPATAQPQPASDQPTPESGPAYVMPAHAGEAFSLTLRLYRPDAVVLAAPDKFNAPRIVKESCR